MPIETMQRAALAGDPEALCGVVLAELGERDGAFDAEKNIARLMQAARSGFAPALRCLGMAAQASGQTGHAREWFSLGWTRGDPLAASFLAQLAEDEQSRLALHALAVTAGVARSAIHLDRAVAPARISAPSQLPPAPDPHSFDLNLPPPRIYREAPRLQTCEDLFNALECEYVIALAGPSLARSMVNDPRTGQPMQHPIRTSQSMAFPGHDGDLWLRQLQRRLAAVAGVPLMHAERLAVLRYGVGEEYRPHRDYLRGDDLLDLRPERPGQRTTTSFCYLNDVVAGGETDFPLLGTKISPRRGRVVMFENVRADGLPDPSTLHAGCPVQQGEKWLATLWFRERPLRDF